MSPFVEINTKHINTIHNVELFNVKPVGVGQVVQSV
jgi:hypothetical protein